MDTQDLHSVLSSTEITPPAEAAQNIERAKMFDITPDAYKDLKPQLDPEAMAYEKIPAKVGFATGSFIKESGETLAVSQNSLKEMNDAESVLTYYDNKILKEPKLRREHNELARKKMLSPDGKLPDAEEERLVNLRGAMDELNTKAPEDMGFTHKLFVDAASSAVDIGRGYLENKELLGATIGGGAALGASVGFIGSAFNPLGAAIGAGTGATQGTVAALAIVPAFDAFKETAGAVYADLTYGTENKASLPLRVQGDFGGDVETSIYKNLELSHERRLAVAGGVAVLSGAAAYGAGKVLASNNPFLKKFTDPSAAARYVLGNPKLLAKMEILGGIVKSGLAEGGEEAFQQVVEKFATEFGKIDGSEESFTNAVENTFNWDTVAETGYSFAVGTIAGGGFATATNAPGYGVLKKQYQETQRQSMVKREVLEHQNMMVEANEILKETELQKLSPEAAKNFKHKLFENLGFDPDAWFTVDDLKAFANSPEKGQRIRNILDMNPETVKLAKETNSAVQLSKAEVLDIMTEFPEITDHMRLTPDGQSPLEIRNEAKTFTEKLSKAEELRAGMMEKMGVVEDTDANKTLLAQALGDLAESPYFANEAEYLDSQPVKPVEGFISEKEAEELNTKHLEARLEVSKSLKEDVDSEFETKTNKDIKAIGDLNSITIQQNGQEVVFDLEQVEKDLLIVDRFKNKSVEQLNAWHSPEDAKKKFPSYAIDPKYLPDDIREHVVNNEMLKQRKVFVKDGISPDDAAAFLGVESGEKLIKILANTPDRKTIQKRKKQMRIELRNQVDQANKADKEAARDAAFSKLTTVHLRELEFMRTKAWPTLKRGIIKIAGRVPTLETLNAQAKETIKGLRVRQLNPNQFKQGEIRSQRTAVKQILSGEPEAAFANKEKAALNTELTREALKAKDKINKATKFWKKMTESRAIQELKDAGYFDVMNEFMELYKLDGAIPNEKAKGQFLKWVKKQAESGEYIPHIPDAFADTRQSYKDMTVEQYQTVTEFGQYIYEKAKRKNAVLSARAERLEFETQETIAENIKRITTADERYDSERAKKEESSADTDYVQNVRNKVKTLLSAFSNAKHIVAKLDNYKPDGYFYKTFIQPLVTAQTAKREENFQLREYKNQVVKQFYGDNKKYIEAISEHVHIPEFAKINSLNNGDITKATLMRLFAAVGDPGGRKAIENYVDADGKRLDFDTVRKVLEREIGDQEALFVQNFFVNSYKRYTDAAAKLHKKTTGIDAEMVQPVSWVHRGKVVEGGYQPLEYQRLPDEMKAQQQLDRLNNQGLINDEGEFFAKLRSAEMTNQDRMRERVGSQRPLDLSLHNHFDALEEIIHDLHFREPGIDLMKIMKNAENVKNMKAIVGSIDYVNMLNGIKDMVGKASDKDPSPIYREQNRAINWAIGSLKSLHAIKTIGFNLVSAAVQFDSLLYLPLRAGEKNKRYLIKNIAKMAANPHNYMQMARDISTILPDIKYEEDQIDDTVIKSHEELIPYGQTFFKNYPKLGKGVTRVRQLRRSTMNASFAMLRTVDKMNKVIAAYTLCDQFLSGDLEGFPKDKLDAMSDKEKKATMQRVVKEIIDLTLTASSTLDKTAIEKNHLGKIFAAYWTDGRSRLNTIAAHGNKIKGNVRKGNYKKAANQLANYALIAGVSGAMVAAIRDREEESTLEKLQNVEDMGDLGLFALEGMYDNFLSPLLDVVPVVNTVKYSAESAIAYGRGNQPRAVSVPVTAVMTDAAMGVVAIKELLESGLEWDDLKKKEKKAAITLGGYMVGGAPTNAMMQLNEVISSNGAENVLDKTQEFMENVKSFGESLEEYINRFGSDPEKQEFIEDMKEYQKSLPPVDEAVQVQMPEGTKETLKQALSEGDWTKFNEDTGAVGLYQFTEEQWIDLMTAYPELNLTENGRLAKDPAQQERAMEAELNENVKNLLAYEIPVTEQNLLGCHEFGSDNFALIYASEDSKKLSEVLGEGANSPALKGFETVGEIKAYLSRKISKPKN
jgi:hypothetical protein